jgi:uncharacterized repeat protein (TIGR03803 family)
VIHLRATTTPLAIALVLALGLATAHAQTLTVLHTFIGGKDGSSPEAGLIRDAHGNLYGTTYYGGDGGCLHRGCGTVFKVNRSGQERVLFRFDSKTGGWPASRLLRDVAGNLYGTTTRFRGTVFEIDPSRKLTTLDAFNVRRRGATPLGDLIQDQQGNLYGTTAGHGDGCGTVFKIDQARKITVLHIFNGLEATDGCAPWGGVVLDAEGNLYGTTTTGGDPQCECGVVFKLSKARQETVLHAFTGGRDGASPYAGLISDGKGDFYGTTFFGGGGTGCNEGGCGTVFKIDATGVETVLYRFNGTGDGTYPSEHGGLVQDKKGNLYGATMDVVFRIDETGKETVLWRGFVGSPNGDLVLDEAGNLYGTTLGGGFGTVFKLTP